MSPCLMSKQVNNDVEKKSLIDKTIKYEKETFKNFHRLIQRKELNILNINKMNLGELSEIMRKLEITIGDRNATLLKAELDNMAKLYTAGQVTKFF